MTEIIASISKFNFWEGDISEFGIPRTKYLNRISEYLGNQLVKVLVGQRRVGKSYLLRQIISKLLNSGVNPHNILYINKEFTEFDFLVSYTDLDNLMKEYKQALKPVGKKYLFIDEIQDIKDWERFVNSFSQNFIEEYEIFISGSNSELLSGELATLLSGRYLEFQILPFNYLEYNVAKQLKDSRYSFIEYLQSGGLPELIHLPNDETKQHYVSAVKDTVLLKDIILRYKIKDAKLLEDLFAFLVNNASNLISISNIVKYFASKNRKTSYETVSNYIGYMESTFLIHKVERYNIKGKEILSGNCKYYINDLAFKNYLYPGFEYGQGYKLENAIYLQLLFSGYKVYAGALRNKEIDFVANKGNRTIYLQVAYQLTEQRTIQREYSALEAISDNYEKYVVSMDEIHLESKEGIGHIQAWNLDSIL
ncbi:MAG: ATP-binding protein [candidate division Zixibacteria bacterium]|nr:ATP-binding protein [candidate division Zixibacteria bacterium]